MKSSGSAQTCWHWYSPCVTHHRQPIVTAYSAGSRVMIEAEKIPESRYGKKPKVNLLKVTANITNFKSTCKTCFSCVEGKNKWCRIMGNWINHIEISGSFFVLELFDLDEQVERYCYLILQGMRASYWFHSCAGWGSRLSSCGREEDLSTQRGWRCTSLHWSVCLTPSSVSWRRSTAVGFNGPLSGRRHRFSVLFPKLIEIGLIKNRFSVIMLVGADAPPPAAVRLIDALRHLRGEEQSDMQVLQLNVR